MNKLWIICITLFLFNCAQAQTKTILLNDNWSFTNDSIKCTYAATVPGNIHTDLLSHKLIPNPYESTNENKVKWVENQDWQYNCKFIINEKDLSNNNVDLNFEGLDTYASIYINDNLLSETDNMFREWSFNIKPYIKIGSNNLKIVFKSAVKYALSKEKKLNYTLPGDEKVFTRKAQYQYGWDWGPRLVTCGIYKPVSIRLWNNTNIRSTRFFLKSINDSVANCEFITHISNSKKQSVCLNLSYSLNNTKTKYQKQYNLTLEEGENNDTLLLQIKQPKKWWPNGEGEQNLYTVSLSMPNSNSYDFKIGLRTVELVRDKDSIGESFYFKINGRSVFMKGANYIPEDNFIARTPSKKTKELLALVKNARMNMLRVWGGGNYPSTEFLNACDELGLLVWQDMMFACAMYPGDSGFIQTTREEIKQQITRMQHHACIALWCGNNEVDEGWHNWGWQKQYNYSKNDSAEIWNNYKNLFHKIIPELITTYDDKRVYHPSSPTFGWGKKQSLHFGDSHYWGVWWGMQPFEIYNEKIGRFMSEYGFQSLPNLNTLKTVCSDSDLSLNSDCIHAHQKHPTGFQTIQTYLERDYKTPTTFDKYIYISQLLQRDGMSTAIEAHRRGTPYCMGTLFWQLNDCWPVSSWSAIDYNNEPKAFYYDLKRLFNSQLISVIKHDSVCIVSLINNSAQITKGLFILQIKTYDGNILYNKTLPVIITPNTSNTIISLKQTELENIDLTKSYIHLEYQTKQETISKNYHLSKPKEMQLKKPSIKFKYDVKQSCLVVTSDTYVKDLCLFSSDSNFKPINNYIDIEAGKTVKIKMISTKTPISAVQYISLFEAQN